MRRDFLRCLLALAAISLYHGSHPSAQAAMATVNVGDNVFTPNALTINVNDQVKWTWAGLNLHSSTSTGSLWNSGIHGNGFAFTNTFASAGNFPYRCSVHALQTGSITVQGTAVPPVVVIDSPANGAVFAAPWTVKIRASASDSDGSVIKVDFYADTTHLGTISNPPPAVDFAVGSLAAGSYTLKAVAMDNQGATAPSADVPISVLTPGPIQISAVSRPPGSSFQFSYSTTPGLTYIVEKSGTLNGWTPIATNTAASSLETFVDAFANELSGFYSVTLAPNP
ncbi:MAG TPA: Ig-like domain-containing protein [Verrucomicrobiae bacterium]